MRTVYGRACDVIREHLPTGCAEPECIANLLQDAGLLAPDLPEPDECPQDIHTPGWRIDQDKYAAVLAGQVHISDYFGWGNSYPPAVIRTMAYKLLAAADYAEKHPPRFRKEGQQ